MKTPAEAARDAYFEAPTSLGRDLLVLFDLVAKAAIDAHLAQVAEGLPTVEEMRKAAWRDGPMPSIRALFAERFSKLQANHERLKANYLQDWIACEKILVSAGIDMEPTEYGGKTVEAGIEELKAERDEVQLNVALGDARLAGIQRIHAEMVEEKDAAIADLIQRPMSDTPRTDAKTLKQTFKDNFHTVEPTTYRSHVDADFARQLERELKQQMDLRSSDLRRFKADNLFRDEELKAAFERVSKLERDLTESQAKGAQLREALENIPIETLMIKSVWKGIEAALSLPPPPVVPLADAQALVDALSNAESTLMDADGSSYHVGGDARLTKQAKGQRESSLTVIASALSSFKTKYQTT